MTKFKILLVEPDPQVLEILMASMVRRFDAHVTCVADAESCLDVEMIDPHDLVICELDLQGSNGLELTRDLRALSNRPVILIGDHLTCDEAIWAMRSGAADLFRRPFAVQELMDSAERLIHGFDLKRQHAAKYHRMRDLVRRVIRERRQLNKRVELICRDLVGAHQRLVHRVLASESVVNCEKPVQN